MSDHTTHTPAVTDDGGTACTDLAPTGRRGLLLGALAATAAAVVLDAPGAGAADPNDVVLGAQNMTTTPTGIRIADGSANGALQLRLPAASVATCASATGGGVGVSAESRYTGVKGYAGDANAGISGVGVQGQAEGPEAIGVSGASNVVGVVGVAGSGTTAPAEVPIGVRGIGGTVVLLSGAGLAPSVAPKHGDLGIGGAFEGDRAALWLVPRPLPGAPTAGPHSVGEIVVDSEGRVHVCRTAGTPGVWSELTAPVAPRLVLLSTPERFVDTRSGLGGVQGPVAAGTTSTVAMTGRTGERNDAALTIPDRATALVGNLSVLGAASATSGSFVTLWPSGPRPATASITYGPDTVISNSFLVGLADTGGGHRGITVYDHGACDYVIDVTGYYVEG